MLQLLRPDLEEPLSRLIGDVPAYGLGSLVRRALGYASDSSRTVARNAGEYFTHERRELVTRAEAGEFLDGVDRLREQADRLEARVAGARSPSRATGAGPVNLAVARRLIEIHRVVERYKLLD